MEKQSVKSRILRSVGYDETAKVLEIEFQSGLVYQYAGVPPKVYRDLLQTEPIGKYYSEKIRPKFTAKPVTPE